MRVLGEIPPQAIPAPRAGTLRRRDLAAFGELLGRLGNAGVVLAIGEASRRRAVAVGLATAAAASGTRTALVECDLEDPALAEELGLAAAPGLREYLTGEMEADRLLKPVALAGPGSAAALDPLVCIVAGRRDSDARGLIRSERFRHAIAKLRSGYDLVVLDGPTVDDGSGTSDAVSADAMAAAAAEADATLACVDRTGSRPDFPVPLTGLVVQG